MYSSSEKEDHLGNSDPIPIEDTITSVKFYPSESIDYLGAASWDHKFRLFEIKYTTINKITYPYEEEAKFESKLISNIKNQSPILCFDWRNNSSNAILGSGDGSINIIDIQKNSIQKIGQHSGLVKEVISYDTDNNIIFSGGTDGIINVYDIRIGNLITSCKLKNKVFSMSQGGRLLVCGFSECVCGYFDLMKFNKTNFQPDVLYSSKLKEQTTKIRLLRNNIGYAQGNIAGRVTIKYIDLYTIPKFENDKTLNSEKDFCFKCHWKLNSTENRLKLFPINDIAMNPKYGSMCTVGGDGQFCFWDPAEKARIGDRSFELKPMDNGINVPLTACNYNQKSTILAYASGYDWTLGMGNVGNYVSPKVYVHYLSKKEKEKTM